MKKLKRTYLNAKEENLYMILRSMLETMEGIRNLDNSVTEEIWVEWSKREMMTPSMRKNIKSAYTYILKFTDELYSHLDKTQQAKLDKRAAKFDYRLIDDYRLKKIYRDMQDHMKYVVMKRDDFVEIMEDVAGVHCVGCTKEYTKCSLHRALEDVAVSYIGESKTCPYACDLSDLGEEDEKNVQALRKRIISKNKFYRYEGRK